jgi:hypothetical protein
MTDLNPQAKQMADESMVRNLDAQARANWPQEVALIRRYALPMSPRILDAGCGTGEASSRLAELFPTADILGGDTLGDACSERSCRESWITEPPSRTSQVNRRAATAQLAGATVGRQHHRALRTDLFQ